MPYIKDENNRREELRKGAVAQNAGELNYQVFAHVKYDKFDKELVKKYVRNFLGETPNYQKYNDMTGALDRCCVEIIRRSKQDDNELLICPIVDEIIHILATYDEEIGEYEDLKIKENGDV